MSSHRLFRRITINIFYMKKLRNFSLIVVLIAGLLSPQQNMIHGDFIQRKFPKNFFDVNVGNPPFAPTKIYGDPDYAKNGFFLHDFFFAKGIDLVRPGGIQVFVTSKGLPAISRQSNLTP